MFAHAMSSTMPVIANSRMTGLRDCLIVELWPRRPSETRTFLARNSFIVRSLIPFRWGASTSLMIE